MNASEIYQYSWFANLAYVTWKDVINKDDENELIATAIKAERLPESLINNVASGNGLGSDIFKKNNWSLFSFISNEQSNTGFAASLFTNGNEKVLAIRGTEPDYPENIQDLLQADIKEIGYLGMALSQTVSLYNYVQTLKASNGQTGVSQLTLLTSNVKPTDVNSVEVFETTNDKLLNNPTYYYFEENTNGIGIGGLTEGETVTVTGHSLGGHLAALASRLFPNLFDQAVTYNSPGFDPLSFPLGNPVSGFAYSNQLTDEFVQLFGDYDVTPDTAFNTSKILTIEAEDSAPGDDTSFVSSLLTGNPASPETYITTEVNSHSMDQLMDARVV